jgi:hypothetical protein
VIAHSLPDGCCWYVAVCSSGFRIWTARPSRFATADERFHPSFQLTPREQDLSIAPGTANANVSAKSDNPPVEAATGMRLAQPYNIPNEKFHWPVTLNRHGMRPYE